jgi:hypothetical protein
MRFAAVLVIGLIALACSQTPATQTNTAASAARVGTISSATLIPSQSSVNAGASPAYGLLIASGHLEFITPDARIAASVPIAEPALEAQACGSGMGAWTLPGVSASNDHVYFRDGNTRIRMVVPPASGLDVTTVPGGPSVITGFSVSPDDRRIAVSVERFTASAISDTLYVEDLRGHTHHADIYTATIALGKTTTMLWPMGWHGGELVLAVWSACTFETIPYPNAWHVADARTAVRRASIGDANCVPGDWASPAGVACFDPSLQQVRVYGLSGVLKTTLHTDAGATELSPDGTLLLASTGGGLGNPSPGSTLLGVDGSGVVNVGGSMACLWIDGRHALSPDAVITYPSGAVAHLAETGQCAGRFPGGL